MEPEKGNGQPDQHRTESPSHPEIKKGIPIAEDIARFRIDLEDRVFKNGLPRGEWRKTYQETLAKYPRIQVYKTLFNDIVGNAEYINDQIQNYKDHFTSAKPLFKYFFDFEPSNDIEVNYGAISINFTMAGDEYRTLMGYSNTTEQLYGAHTRLVPNMVPVIVQNRDAKYNMHDYNFIHELEHAKNAIMIWARSMFIVIPENFKIDSPRKVIQEIKKREARNKIEDIKAKDEILAYFGMFDISNPQNFPSAEHLNTAVTDLSQAVKDLLLDRNGLYLPYYQQQFSLSEIDIQLYEKKVTKGLNAFNQLFKLYLEQGLGINATKMATHILEQFPIVYWPAVTTLITKRYQHAKIP